MADEREYDELQIRISRGRGRSYRVSATASEGRRGQGTFVNPFTDIDLELFRLRLGIPRGQVRGNHSSGYRTEQMQQAKDFGAELCGALLKGPVREVYQDARTLADSRERGMRLSLYLGDAPELMKIPWEFIWDRGFLAQSPWTPLVRSLDLQYATPPKRLEAPLKILGIISSPTGVDELDVDKERKNLESALKPLGGVVELSWLKRATLAELERRIAAPDDVHVLHFIGHGSYDQSSGSGILLFEDNRGEKREVSGEELCSLVKDERSLRLAVLNSCEGGRTSDVDPFSGVASALIECAIPAVVAMQFAITDPAAIVFSQRLYEELSQGAPIDAAVAQTRKAVWTAGRDAEFGTPVLFVRAGVGRLFQIDTPAHPERAADPDVNDAAQAAAAVGRRTQRTRTSQVGAKSTKPRRKSPKVTVLQQNGQSVDLALEFEHSIHHISWRTGLRWKDILTLDGKTIWEESSTSRKEHHFEISDGRASLSAFAKFSQVTLISYRLTLFVSDKRVFGSE